MSVHSTNETTPVFQIGKPIPKVWLHMEFDFNDTQKYLGDVVIDDQEELERLNSKYLK